MPRSRSNPSCLLPSLPSLRILLLLLFLSSSSSSLLPSQGVILSPPPLLPPPPPSRHLESFSSARPRSSFRLPLLRPMRCGWLRETMWSSPGSPWLLWCLALLLAFAEFAAVEAFTGTYGINYGRIADNIPPPESVVTLLKAAKIRNVRIYDADPSVLTAFKGSGIELIVAIGNQYLKEMSVSEDSAMDWLKKNVQPFLPDTHIRGIAVGNEVLGGPDQELAEALLGAIKNVYSALERLQLTDIIEVSTPHSQAVFGNSFPPSSCTFKENVFLYIKPILDFFSRTGSPFYINAYPFLAYKSDPEHIDINYALFKSNPGIYDAKTGLHYDNMFDAQIDAAYAALEAAGYEKMEVRVSETGWASSGDEDEAGATVQNARTYNYNLYKRLVLKKGTPLRPKIAIKAYVFALFNEDLKPGPSSERHFGLFKADGSIAYYIGFTGLRPSHASLSLLSLKDMLAQGWLVPYSLVLTTCAATMLFVFLA